MFGGLTVSAGLWSVFVSSACHCVVMSFVGLSVLPVSSLNLLNKYKNNHLQYLTV